MRIVMQGPTRCGIKIFRHIFGKAHVTVWPTLLVWWSTVIITSGTLDDVVKVAGVFILTD